MLKPRKPVELRVPKSIQTKLNDLKETNKPKYDFVKKMIDNFKNDYPISDLIELHPINADGTRNFVVDSGYNVTFAGWEEKELPDKHIVHIIKLIY